MVLVIVIILYHFRFAQAFLYVDSTYNQYRVMQQWREQYSSRFCTGKYVENLRSKLFLARRKFVKEMRKMDKGTIVLKLYPSSSTATVTVSFPTTIMQNKGLTTDSSSTNTLELPLRFGGKYTDASSSITKPNFWATLQS